MINNSYTGLECPPMDTLNATSPCEGSLDMNLKLFLYFVYACRTIFLFWCSGFCYVTQLIIIIIF